MYKDIFLQVGLNQNESTVYEYLLQKGKSTARQITKNTPLKRGVVYNTLDELSKKELISKDEGKKITYFSPNHPEKIKTFLEKREKNLEKSKATLEANLYSIISTFNLASSQPGVKYLEGIEGFQKTYEDILKTNQDVLLFRSVLDNANKEADAIIKRHLKLQAARKIHTRAITPLVKGTPETILNKDASRLVERRIVLREKFSLPAQIIVYANKVALTSFDEGLITTVIENDAIALSLRAIFEFLWDLSTPMHKDLYKKIISGEIKKSPSKFFE